MTADNGNHLQDCEIVVGPCWSNGTSGVNLNDPNFFKCFTRITCVNVEIFIDKDESNNPIMVISQKAEEYDKELGF